MHVALYRFKENQLNINNNLIILNNEDKTQNIERCNYINGKYEVVFSSSPQVYSYSYLSVMWIRNPKIIDINSVKISHNEKALFGIIKILQFDDYYRIFFENGKSYSYRMGDLVIEKNSLLNKNKNNCFEYFKRIAKLVSITTDDGKNILSDQYEKMGFVSSDSVLSTYLQPEDRILKHTSSTYVYYPFGCNLSQMQAVENALSNKISVIEGPPGTGKTQTILNIIANAVINDKTVAVVSNNNSATDNVFEKLQGYGFEFIAAPLGKSDNKKEFVNRKQTYYPDFSSYKYESTKVSELKEEVLKLQKELKEMLNDKNRIAGLRSKLSEFKLEKQYFDEFYKETYNHKLNIRNIKKLKSKQILNLWNECQVLSEQHKNIGLLFKLKSILYYGIFDMPFLNKPISDIIPAFQNLYYILKVDELKNEIQNIENKLNVYNFKEKQNDMKNKSLAIFRNSLYEKYRCKKERQLFTEEDLWKDSVKFNTEYPIILSTTYSLRNCLSRDHLYDYVIVDESSQVDLITGVLTLSCAKNAVIVGDLMQLPNVVPDKVKEIIKQI